MKPLSNASKDTQKRILDIAEQLLLTRGFNAFSYQHISSALGVRNAAVHYHFPHKTDLGVALVQRYRRRFARFMEAHASLDPLQQLEGYFELTDAYFQQDEQICPSGILTTEYHTLPEEIQLEASAFITEMRDWAKTIARRGQDEGVMTYPGSPEAMGEVMFAALQGGLQLARIDAGILNTIKQQIRDLLKVEKP